MLSNSSIKRLAPLFLFSILVLTIFSQIIPSVHAATDTFGRTATTSNWNTFISVMYTSNGYSPASDGSIESISVYLRRSLGTDNYTFKAALYMDEGGGFDNASLVTSGELLNVPYIAGWRNVTVTSADIYSTEVYYFSIRPSIAIDVNYGTYTADACYIVGTNYDLWPPDPHGIPTGTDNTGDSAIYGTYTVSGGTAYTVDLSESLNSDWDVLTQTSFNVLTSQSLTSIWDQEIVSAFNVDFSKTLVSTWSAIIQGDFNAITTLDTVTSWLVDTFQAKFYLVELTLSLETTWNVFVYYTSSPTGGYATKGFVLVAFLFTAFITVPLVIIIFRRKS